MHYAPTLYFSSTSLMLRVEAGGWSCFEPSVEFILNPKLRDEGLRAGSSAEEKAAWEFQPRIFADGHG